MKYISLFILFLGLNYSLLAQTPPHLVRPSDTLKKDAFINTVEQTFKLFLADYANKNNYDSIISALNYEPGQIPQFTDEEYCARLKKMNEASPFKLDCTPASLSTIKFFAENRRGFARIVLGRSTLFFDLFEEKLAEYGLPLELKFLSVIESGLRPQVKSRAGALGLWQFMYRTGLYFGLKENSYIDERMDPAAATDAACRYLKQLYGIYGDWNLALAAYNAGPGNVNKAIRRSGNKTTYWEVRPYLPAETQGYVPNFIAAAYLLTYHAEHNIVPMDVNLHYAQIDTMCLSRGVSMTTISKLVNWPLDDIKALNPVYKTTYIPKTKPFQCISGPLDRIGLLVSLEDSLYWLEDNKLSPPQLNPNPMLSSEVDTVAVSTLPVVETPPAVVDTVTIPSTLTNFVYHKVRSGENMRTIAIKYGIAVEQIMEWNALRTTNIYVGQRLKVIQAPASIEQEETPVPEPRQTRRGKKYYNVRSGDTFLNIARRYDLTQQQLKKLNPRIDVDRLTVGQQLRVK
jgi:membrane-bound lytic murein transglycosylase D